MGRHASSRRLPSGDVRGAPCRTARSEAGQGTTEYAILVGVIVVMAIFAIIAFRGRIQELWDSIVSGIGQL